MRIGIGVVLGIGLVLAGCGGGRNNKAAAACNTEIGKRMNGRSFTVDLKDLAAHAKEEAADTVLLTSTIVLDKGLPSEDKQTYECRVRFDASGTPSVLFLQFNWNTSELQQSQ